MGVKFSIVMPVYNSERTIERALNSVVQQSYQDYELIVVDDGSKDSSFEICKSFESKYKNIRLFSQQNSGPSSARNCGLAHVEGDYLMFLDSDDFLEQDALANIHEHIKKSKNDVYFISWKTVRGDDKKDHLFSKDELGLNLEEIFRSIVISPDMCGGGYPWNKIWRVETIKEDSFVEFDESLSAYEDKLWTLQNLDRIHTFEFINIPIYNYLLLDSSLSHYDGAESIAKLWSAYEASSKIYNYIESNHSSAIEQADNLKWLFLLNYTFGIYISKRNYVKKDMIRQAEIPFWNMNFRWLGLKPTIKYILLKLYVDVVPGSRNFKN